MQIFNFFKVPNLISFNFRSNHKLLGTKYLLMEYLSILDKLRCNNTYVGVWLYHIIVSLLYIRIISIDLTEYY